MKEDLPYFSHDNNASQHPKMKALIAEYGFEGYGRFWVLNEKIAQTAEAYIDISRKIYKLDLAKDLGFNSAELDKFLKFLSDPEIDLINIVDNKISTDRINELHKKIIEKRKSRRKDSQNDENGEMNEHFDTEENRINKNRENKNKINSDNFTEPLTESQKQALELSELLLISHRKEFPDYLSGKDTKKITEKWAADVEKLIRIDKKSPETIKRVILWVKTLGNFWFQNIESGKKLREKFERLYGQMVTEVKTELSEKNAKRQSYIPDAEQTEVIFAEIKEAEKNRATDGNLLSELLKITKEKNYGQ